MYQKERGKISRRKKLLFLVLHVHGLRNMKECSASHPEFLGLKAAAKAASEAWKSMSHEEKETNSRHGCEVWDEYISSTPARTRKPQKQCLTLEQKDLVKSMGFGSLVGLRCQALRRSLCLWLLERFNTTNHSLEICNKQIPLTPKDVELVMGLSASGKDVVNSGPDDIITDLRDSYSATNRGISVRFLEEPRYTDIGTVVEHHPVLEKEVNQDNMPVLLEMDWMVCGDIEVVVESVGTPCQNKENGCNETVDYMNEDNHETTCIFAPCACPLEECNYVGSSEQLSLHFSSKHWDSGRRFKYNCPLAVSVCLMMNEQFIVLQAEVLFLLNKGTESIGITMIIIGLGHQRSSFLILYQEEEAALSN
ncbi:E3 ubiquitin-protein ligase [Quillaja saponaria]|uniref:E3 ubiquitin-protein ligase n=2 Tax=Quillaja saponaria TaxID=32244 RepID=A0AAD7M600_QUISA|nr:E3 ubiquitin-protein ligase [Quillaja saponaria]